MDLIGKVAIIAVVIVVVIGGIKLITQSTPSPISESQAVANVTRFLLDNNPPGTIINITSVSQSQYAGSWHIVAGVIQNSTRPCPSYYVYSFDYPQYTFVEAPDNTYTSNCIVNGISNSTFVIGYYPVAIARSYSLHIPIVISFVNDSGYSNVVVRANKVNYIVINGTNYTDVWVVYYTSSLNTNTVQVYLQQNGNLITAT